MSGRKIRNFRDLDVWRMGMEIAKMTYRVCRGLPSEERYGLSMQMRRAAVSIPSNIAEGFNRYHNREYRQFLFVALGSCAELETQTQLCRDLGLAGPEAVSGIAAKLDLESRMLRSLVRKLG